MQENKKYVILGSLCAIIITMTIAYAAFQTNLKIKGTSSITSNWDILITNIQEINKGGNAVTTEKEGKQNPSWDGLSASIEADLFQKGDFIEYEVTIENKGTLDAVLENVNEQLISQNEAILISFSGYTKGEKLAKGTSQKIIVRIEYNPEFNGIPEIGKTEINFTLNYAQAEGGVIKPIYNITTSKNNIVNLTVIPDTVSAKEGDTVTFSVPTSSEYTYVGSYIYDDLDNKIIELDNSEKSFIMPNHDIRIAPIFKYNNFTIMNGSSRDTTFNFKNIRADATSLTYSTDYTSSHVLSLMSDLSAWSFGGLYSTKKYNLSKYSKIVFDNNAEIISGTTARNAIFGVVKDINKGLAFDTSNKLQIVRTTVSSAKVSSEVNIDELQNDTTPYHIGIEYSTANIQTRLYIWRIILIGRTYYS